MILNCNLLAVLKLKVPYSGHISNLTLKAPITTAADNIFILFLFFKENKLIFYAAVNSQLKWQDLFFLKIKK